ncbi:DNA primase [Rhodoluna lacicola]|jgi:DNA primase|uniref:DNA primase n=1 Tax=Rhodoluna lacicola TaxID=529884 RepID=A0A060JC37_9MICO|nr:DNA primase [Rhodoluna lacicola]AIC47441.1 DNA primase, catalytic core [Rhodoluna lacicola]
MAGKIRARDIEEVKSRVNIADVVGEYVSLKNASVGSLKGLCPFHDEKSPSFNVRPMQGFYHCFGCGEGGDVYKFLQQMESISFYEAVEKLAARVGFELTYEDGGPAADQGQRSRILEANTAAATFYQSQLMTDDAIPGRDFLKGRGFDKAAAEQFGIGFAPKGWSNLTDHLKKLGFTIDELVAAGLATKSDRGAYDKFRGRLIWPIRDSTSQVIGFGARKLFEDDQGPKYLNTSDTLVYHKSAVLYGIDLAKKEISKQQRVVVVEGYTDVMACHLAGITTAVATCGTAFGDDHIRLLNRMLSAEKDTPAEVIFTFDPDAAGQKAAMRAFNDSHKFSAQTFVAVGPDGLDPCDLRSEKGDDAVRLMIENKKPLFEFAIKQKIAKFDLSTIEGRVGAARAAAPVVSAIRDSAMRPAYIRELAGWVNLDGNEVASLVDAAAKESRSDAVKELRRDQQTIETESGTSGEGAFALPNLNDPITRFERQVLEVLVQVPNSFSKEQLIRIVRDGFSDPAHNAILEAIGTSLVSHGSLDWLNVIGGATPAELHSLLRSIAAQSLPAKTDAELVRYGQGVVSRALTNALAHEKADLLAALRRTDAVQDAAESARIQRALVDLETERRKLQGL